MLKMKTCKQCDTRYERHEYSYLKSSFCSRECQSANRRNSVIKKCRNCGNDFDFKPSQAKAYPNAGKYCSRKCGYEYRVRIGVDKPTNDRYGRTSRKADKEWQLAVRLKDNYTCRRCNIYQPYIHTHHVAARSQRPDLKHDVDNGICLCAVCHSWVHQNPKASKELGFISDARYGVESKIQRIDNAAKARNKGKSFVLTCGVCRAEKTYYESSRHKLNTENYRCVKHLKGRLKGDK